MKVKRIATLRTFKAYEEALHKLAIKYVVKAMVRETPEEIVEQIKHRCHNPFALSCVIIDKGNPVGFVLGNTALTAEGKKVLIDHLHSPNLKMTARVVEILIKVLAEKIGAKKSDITFLTHRNPEAWIRYATRIGLNIEQTGWVLAIKEE